MRTNVFSLLCVALLGAAAITSGCGNADESTSSVRAIALSPVLLSEPPPQARLVVFQAASPGARWRATGGTYGGEVLLEHVSEDEPEVTLAPSGAEMVTYLAKVERAGVQYLVAATLDANNTPSIHRWHDSSGDGVPDASTETLLLALPTIEMYLTGGGFVDSDEAFLFDSRCGDILWATDSNADGWIDSIAATPFASSANFPILEKLAGLQTLAADSSSSVSVALANLDGSSMAVSACMHWTFEDSDDDNVADSVTPDVQDVASRPVIFAHAFDGQVDLRVRYRAGETVRVYTLDTAGDPDVLLGSVTLVGDDFESASLQPALVAGDDILVTAGTDATSPNRVYDVRDARPQLVAAAPSIFKLGDGTTHLDVYGASMNSSMTVYLVTAAGTQTQLTYTYTSAGVITVTLPALTASDVGVATIYALESGQDIEDGLISCNCEICAAGE